MRNNGVCKGVLMFDRRQLLVGTAAMTLVGAKPANAFWVFSIAQIAHAAVQLVAAGAVSWLVADYLDTKTGRSRAKAKEMADFLKQGGFDTSGDNGRLYERGQDQIMLGTTLDTNPRTCTIYGENRAKGRERVMYEGTHPIAWAGLLEERRRRTGSPALSGMYPKKIVTRNQSSSFFKTDSTPLVFETDEGGHASIQWVVEGIDRSRGDINGVLLARYDLDGRPSASSIEMADRMRLKFLRA